MERGPFRCGRAARWLPRVLAASVLVSAMWVGLHIDPEQRITGSRPFRTALVVAAAGVALWIVRKGGELHIQVELEADQLVLASGAFRASLRYEQIEVMRWEAPFATTRNWLPATALVDRRGGSWRLSGLLDGGERLVDALIARSGREDLEAWSDALGIRKKMAAASRRVLLGYGAAGLILVAGAAHALQ